MGLYIQYGCGFSAPDGWTNYDASPTLRFERLPLIGKFYVKNKQRFPEAVIYGNIVDGLPEADDSCDGIYCSHILEHLSYKDFQSALKNTLKLLKPGGIFRCVVPDLRYSVQEYLDNYELIDNPASLLMRSTMLGREDRARGITGVLKDMAGNSKHFWMWDEKSLITELINAGFKNPRACKFNDSLDSNFKLVEDEDRFQSAVAIECTK